MQTRRWLVSGSLTAKSDSGGMETVFEDTPGARSVRTSPGK